MRANRCFTWVIGAAALVAVHARAQVPRAHYEFTGRESVRASGCGKSSNDVAGIYANVNHSGVMDIGTPEIGVGGTAQVSGRVASFVIDASNVVFLADFLAQKGSELCYEVLLDTVTLKKATLKVNKRDTRAKLRIAAMATGWQTIHYELEAVGDHGPEFPRE